MLDPASPADIDETPPATKAQDALLTLVRALGRHAARQMWSEGLRSGSSVAEEAQLLARPGKRTRRGHAGR